MPHAFLVESSPLHLSPEKAPAQREGEQGPPPTLTGSLRMAAVRASGSLREHIGEMRRRHRVAAIERAISRDPENHHLWRELAVFHESHGLSNEAASCYSRLAGLHRKRRGVEEMASICRKLDQMASPETARLYRELAALCSEERRFEEASRACRRVAELYLAEGQTSALAGYARQLPQLGPLAAGTRAEIEGMLGRRAAPEPPVRSTARLAAPATLSPTAGAGEVFLSGQLGRITTLDVVQIIESHRVTGRFEVEQGVLAAWLYFDDGRIVAARVGALTGHDAAHIFLDLDSGSFRVVQTRSLPPREFPPDTSALDQRNREGEFLFDRSAMLSIDDERRETGGLVPTRRTAELRGTSGAREFTM